MPPIDQWVAFEPLAGSPVAIAALLLAALYLRGAIWMWRHGCRWAIARTASFLIGCVLIFAVTTFGVNRLATESIAALVFQQITLLTVVPPLLIAGSPGRLLLRSTPHTGLGRLILCAAHGGLRSRFWRAALHPVVAIVTAMLLYPTLYLTDAISAIMRIPFGHDALLFVILVLGIVSATPLWSSDPLPRAPSFAARFIDIAVEIQIHAIFGLVLLRTSTLLFSAYNTATTRHDPALDQAIAGSLVWTYAELPLFVVLIVCLSRWRARDARTAKQRQKAEDAELDAYNDYLATLSRARDEN
ncbi:cytochrome c oxidase assembly protein [Microbacterium sp. OR21]|uniref:cytochrome c oxidase assembly protein n=1 Tax=Microbacterium sp. OR21 TaxID=3095346 RepID=UPI0039B46318